jgi:hypothetical protein
LTIVAPSLRRRVPLVMVHAEAAAVVVVSMVVLINLFWILFWIGFFSLLRIEYVRKNVLHIFCVLVRGVSRYKAEVPKIHFAQNEKNYLLFRSKKIAKCQKFSILREILTICDF